MTERSPAPIEPSPDLSSGLVIRAVRESDCEAINAMSNLPGFRSGTLRLPYERLEATKAWLTGLKPDDLALVAILDRAVVAGADLERFGGRRAHVAALGIGVHDAFCGRGIGTALVGALVEAADQWLDIRRIELSVYTDNRAAIRLYERFGFQAEGVERCSSFRAGVYADTLAMARLRP